jgi:hypothetical protein
MTSKILVDRNTHGGAMVTFEDRHGFVAVEYLDAAQVEELISKLRGTWTQPTQPTPTHDAHPGYLHSFKDGRCVYRGCKAEPEVTPFVYREVGESEPFTTYSTHDGRDREGCI